PTEDDLYKVGVICEIKQVVNIPNSSNARVAVEGLVRARLVDIVQEEPYFRVNAEILNDIVPEENELKYESAYERLVKREFEKYISLVPR
ncbi:LON peptidase substrate-binding domain-containing protein, partial [Acinetobacter baumannii]|uniref:LON peptidase substrate-binding domain-containing protein n=1 Tax=Acinetobacter baumannii TaxID=470 RepID=UPI0031F3F8AB